MPIRVLVADSQPIFRCGLLHELGAGGRVWVVGEADNGDEALALVGRLHPEVLLLDLLIQGMPAFAVITRAREGGAIPRIVGLGSPGDRDALTRLMTAGMAGVVSRAESSAAVLAALEAVAAGGIWFSVPVRAGAMAAEPGDSRPGPPLTPRELQVLRLLADGGSNKGIARAMSVSERTVRFHLGNIYEKLALDTRGELVAWAASALLR